MSGLLELDATDDDPAELILCFGEVLATFDHRTQDSGNVSWVLRTGHGDLFVKTAGIPAHPPPGARVPYLGHGDRVRLLRNAVILARSCDHPCLARLRNVIESPTGPALVYDRAPGELIGTTRSRRSDPDSAYQRFAHLPAHKLLAVIGDLIDLHRALAAAGWVAIDLYDGCMIVDLDTARLTVVDLDTYHLGPTTNTMGRMFGSTRFMAPEEFELGSAIDERTTVYTLARIAWHFGTRLTEHADQFCGTDNLAAALNQALEPDPAQRYESVAAFAHAWNLAR